MIGSMISSQNVVCSLTATCRLRRFIHCHVMQDVTNRSTELIRSVRGMLDYLEPNEMHRNGYHLAEVLTQSRYISGNQNIHDIYCRKMMCHYQEKQHALKFLKKLMIEEVPFHIVSEEDSKQKLKRLFYRVLVLALNQLKQLFDLPSSTSFSIVADLEKRGVINKTACHNL